MGSLRATTGLGGLVAIALAACTVTWGRPDAGASKTSDGQACSSNVDCKSGYCSNQVCMGSSCSCSGDCGAQGSPSSDCESGWLCVYSPPDPISGFFGASGDNSCLPICGPMCPTHWDCEYGGSFCSYDALWSQPVVSITGPASGQTGESIAFHASATSPAGAPLASYAWSFGDVSGATATGADVSHTFDQSGTYTVSIQVTDGQTPPMTGSATASVTVCSDAGGPCSEYSFSGCCAGLTCTADVDAGGATCH